MSDRLLRLYDRARRAGPTWRGRLLAAMRSPRLQVGKNVTCDGFPTLIIDDGARVIIDDDVIIRSGVEIRAHGTSILHIGAGCRIDRDVRLLAANEARVNLGAKTRIGIGTVLNGGDSVTLGKGCLVSGYVYLQSSMHRHKAGVPIHEQGYDHGPIVIEDDVWLAAHVVIMPGIQIGRGAVVGSNAVVTKNVASDQIVAGVPAKALKSR